MDRRSGWKRPNAHKQKGGHRHPPGLKGKDIGMYYRNLQKNKKEITKREVNFAMPPAVLAKVLSNLQTIVNFAQLENIPIHNIKKTASFNFSKSECDTPKVIKMEPSSSKALDVQPVKTGCGSDEKRLSLKGAGDYKYSYEDIITGTFQEKLDKSISEGITINSHTENNLNQVLYEEYKKMTTKHQYKKMMEFRKTLPTYKKRDELLNAIKNNQVIVISGETGCGKSTQVPQLILDDAIANNKGANVKILVTQPRRIAASSLAVRVAEERAEKLGNSVGYAVRLEKVECRPRGSITFCTTGILLADLEVNQGLTNYSHIILDEVHERDVHIDLSMCVLKQVLMKRKDLKVILMSATIDADKLSTYFDNCPMLHIEGLAYPVTDFYLEDILKLTKFRFPEEASQQPTHAHMPWKKQRQIRKKEALDIENAVKYRAEIGPWLESIKKKLDRNVYLTLQDWRVEAEHLDIILALLMHICKGEPGAVLIFLPGIGDITKLSKMIHNSESFPSSRFNIHLLHSKLSSLEQKKIFERPPKGVRKIIIATNIAETSITVDDIVYVIDCGKVKITGLNVEQNISTLQNEWISKANLRQRRGRAGRCQEGICYHVLTSYRAEKLLDRHLPELQRGNLLEAVLAVKQLRLGKAIDALKLTPDPPAEATIERAVKHLQEFGALDNNETLTPLGWHLARLPVHPSAGKLLLLGALFGCLDRAASVAAVWGFKDPFVLVVGKEKQVDEAKQNFALGEPSDHIAISEAIIEWERLDYHQRRDFSYGNFLSNHTIQLLSEMKKQFGNSLKQMGFLPSGSVKAPRENRNANNLSLFKAIVAASLYPNIGTVRWTGIGSHRHRMRVRVWTPEDGRVALHPSSVMVSNSPGKQICSNPGANWLVYWIKQKSTELYLFDVTCVYTLPLLFFGEFKVTDAEPESSEDCFISISSIEVRCAKETAAALIQLRSLLDQVLASKIMASGDQSQSCHEFEEYVLNAVIEVLTAEDEQVEYFEDEDNSNSDVSESESSRKKYY